MKPINKSSNKTLISSLRILTIILLGMFLSACRGEGQTDITPPVPGGNGVVSASEAIPFTWFCIWDAATDDTTPTSELDYMVYRSGDTNIDTIDNCKANGTALTGWLTATTMITISPSFGWNYYTVIVRDNSGNESIYQISNLILIT